MRFCHHFNRVVIPLHLVMGAAISAGQDVQPAEPPTGAKELLARAVAVQGRVLAAPVGAQPTDQAAWKAVQVGDDLSQGMQVRVGLRSSVMLQFGDDAIVQLKPMTLASLDELYQTESMKRSRIGLAYGAIRGSVREKTLRTDMVIEAPAVTCSKEGTHDFGLRTMRGSTAWWAEGPTEGMIMVRDATTGRTERLAFGQIVDFLTQTETPVKRNLFAQAVDFYDQVYMSDGELDFNYYIQTGRTIIGPGLGFQTWSSIPGARGVPISLSGVQSAIAAGVVGQALARGNLAFVFRQVESRFGTGPLPDNAGRVARKIRRAMRR